MTESPPAAFSPAALLRSARVRGRVLALLREAAAEEVCVRAATQADLKVSDAELQQAADRYRLRNGLSSAEATRLWLAEMQLTADEWEGELERELLVEKLKDHLAAAGSADHFAAHADRYARVRLRRLVVASEGLARELLTQVREEGRSLNELAARTADPTAGDLGEVFRFHLSPAVADAAFAASVGDVVGPFPAAGGFELFQVGDRREPELDGPTAAAVREAVFSEWLTGQMAGVSISLGE